MATTKRATDSPTKHAKTSAAKSTSTTKAAPAKTTPSEKTAETKPAKRAEAPNTVAPTAKAAVTYDQIARRAYQLWEQRGYAHGSHEQDWLTAERQLCAEV